MSPPDTNTRRQARRHWPVFIALALVVLFGVGIILYWVGEEAAQAPEPDETGAPDTVQDLREGDVAPQPDVPERAADPEPLNPGTPEL
ncbi:hypothetical protein JF540_24085 [Salipiger thiooxidans]|uniref:hypothetical protein n=1 Tax=Salipiger thiooxidans TaxID=282683 RepID=UPI001A909B3D|nr:hypothetical protein [Salipiger thiooxidans]MBN8189772.1 hypothetical protein [Salipiger thiooxidans]